MKNVLTNTFRSGIITPSKQTREITEKQKWKFSKYKSETHSIHSINAIPTNERNEIKERVKGDSIEILTSQQLIREW